MFHVVLFQPEIPPNTGNIIRLCANCGARLHLIRPLGFTMSNSLAAFAEAVQPARILACSTRGRKNYSEVAYGPDDALLFGPETRGLPDEVLDSLPADQLLRIPMQPGNRSLNLSNAVAIITFEAWRQAGFAGSVECLVFNGHFLPIQH